ncbi:MAG: NAD-dependent epimerase/dehydratase family protein [Candidatus Omnitrophica bacterium]|nr:NAD-dependent epimerase/dehydratase family protein [Candidatus Omnitrophota bacterium]
MSEPHAFYKNKTLLVTGAAGYLGQAVIAKLSAFACKIIALDKEPGPLEALPQAAARVSLVKADIHDKNIWREHLGGTDVLFHFAAQTSSRFANENPLLDLEANLVPIINMIEACRKEKISPQIIFSGTVTQAGLTPDFPVNETIKDSPVTIYDINKLAAERYLEYYSNELGGEALTLRLANVYGPGQTSSSMDRGILNAFIRKAINSEPLTIYGDGNYIRDYIYIDDVVEAFLIAALKLSALKGSHYLIGSGSGTTIKDAAGLIKEIVSLKTGREAKIQNVDPPDGISRIEFRNFVADSAKFCGATGWKAKVDLREGISRTIEHFLSKEGR